MKWHNLRLTISPSLRQLSGVLCSHHLTPPRRRGGGGGERVAHAQCSCAQGMLDSSQGAPYVEEQCK